MKRVVYAVVYDDPTLFYEWFYSLSAAIAAVSFNGGGEVHIALIPNQAWNFYDVGIKLKMVARIESPYKWRIKNA